MTTPADRQPLEKQIAQWRLYLRRRRAIHDPDVEELEGHLRDQTTSSRRRLTSWRWSPA